MALADERYVSLTTFRRDGSPVATPVWVAGHEGRLLVWTGAGTHKVQRLRRDPRVLVAPSTGRGEVTGGAVAGTAVVLEDTTLVLRLLGEKYGLQFRLLRRFNALVRVLRRRPQGRSVTLEIRLDE